MNNDNSKNKLIGVDDKDSFGNENKVEQKEFKL